MLSSPGSRAAARERRGGRLSSAAALIGPATIFVTVSLVVPILILFRYSLNAFVPGRLMVEALTVENYVLFVTDPYYLAAFTRTLRVAVTVTVIALVAAFPLAYRLARTESRYKHLLIMLVVLPLFVGNAVRAAGWMTLFTTKGFVNVALQWLGLTTEPLRIMYTEFAVIVGILAVNLPYVVLTLSSVIEGIDRTLEDAAFSLGAGPWAMARRVLWPLALPGVAAGAIFCFILTMNAYATPVLLGGPQFVMMAPLVYVQFAGKSNWPFGRRRLPHPDGGHAHPHRDGEPDGPAPLPALTLASSDRTLEAAVTGSLRWRCIGPHRGGRVVAVAGCPADRMTFYFGACAGGVWKTTDGGLSWLCISDGFLTTAAVGALAVAPSDRNVIYAGTGEACIRNDVSHGDGVYRSTDGERRGATSGSPTPATSAPSPCIRTIPTSSTSPRSATPGGPTDSAGCSAPATAARTWRHVLYRSERAGAHDVALDPLNPRVLYAAVWQAQRYPHALAAAARTAACGARPTAGRPGPTSRGVPACREACSARSASPSRRSRSADAAGAACGRSSRPKTAPSSSPTTAGTAGSGRRSSRRCARGPGTTCTSPPTRGTPIPCTSRTTASGSRSTRGGRSGRSRPRTATTTRCGSTPAIPGA